MVVFNVLSRLFVVVVGVLVLLSVPPFVGLSSPLQEVFGTVVVLFGVLRLVLYLSNQLRKDSQGDV